VTYFFSGREQGWSEGLIYPIGDSVTPQQAYVSIFRNIAQLRAELLAREYSLDFVRVAIIYNTLGQPVKRAVFLANPGFTPSLQTAVNSGEQPNACVLMQWVDSTGTRKKKSFLGGSPDAIFTDAGVYQPTQAGNWGSRWSAWAQANNNASAGWLLDNVTLSSNIVGIVANANLTKTFATQNPIFTGVPAGSIRTVRVKQVNGTKSVYNGSWQVEVIDDSHFTTVDAFSADVYRSGGVATAYAFPKPVAVALTEFVEREGTHKRGKPAVATRGRLPARARL
jgi:hypothetical protein